MKTLAVVILIALGLIAPAFATTEGPKTISRIGADTQNAHLIFTIPLSDGCAYNLLYISLTNGKEMLSIAMTARAMGVPLSRVDYTKTGSDCYATLLEY